MDSPSKFDKHSDGEGDSPNIGDIKNNTASPLATQYNVDGGLGVVTEAKA